MFAGFKSIGQVHKIKQKGDYQTRKCSHVEWKVDIMNPFIKSSQYKEQYSSEPAKVMVKCLEQNPDITNP